MLPNKLVPAVGFVVVDPNKGLFCVVVAPNRLGVAVVAKPVVDVLDVKPLEPNNPPVFSVVAAPVFCAVPPKIDVLPKPVACGCC